MKITRFAVLSLMSLLSATAFAQAQGGLTVTRDTTINAGDTVRGYIEIKAGKTLTNKGVIVTDAAISGQAFSIKNDGRLINEGEITFQSTLYNGSNGTFRNETTGKVNGSDVKNDGSITNNGEINANLTNNGTFSNAIDGKVNGNIMNTGTFHTTGGEISGNIRNAGTFTNSGKISGEITVHENATFSNDGEIDSSELEVYGTFDNNARGEISTTKVMVDNGDDALLTNRGKISGSTIEIRSELVNEEWGRITDSKIELRYRNSSVLKNKGTIEGNDTVFLISYATLINDATGTISCNIHIVNHTSIDRKIENKGRITNAATVNLDNGIFINHASGSIGCNLILNQGEITNDGTADTISVKGGICKNNSRAGIVSITGGGFTNNGTADSISVSEGTCLNSNEARIIDVTGGELADDARQETDWNFHIRPNGTFILKAGTYLDLNMQEPSRSRIIESGARVVVESGAVLEGYTRDAIIRKHITAGRWNFMGLAMDTCLQAFRGVATEENPMYALAYNYTTNNWDNNYLYIDYANIPLGEGILVYTTDDTQVDFVVSHEARQTDSIAILKRGYITQHTDAGNWLALSNPYFFPMSVSRIATQLTQGSCVYTYKDTTWVVQQSGDTIDQCEGFLVNIPVDAPKEIKLYNPNLTTDDGNQPTAVRSFLTVSVSTDGYKVPVSFAQNDAAMAGYDIFDANKLFGNGTVAEPYLVCNGVNLCKEEVNEASYAATMNIRSSEARRVEIAADIVPEGYSLVLKDGETETPMNQGDIYTTDIASGENAERFKLLINKNNVSLDEIAATEKPRVSSFNRNIIIEGGERVRTEVFNTLGQKVYETTKRNFTLNDLEAGAYVLRVQSTSGMQSSKIVIR